MFACFYIWSIEFAEKKDFESVKCLSNETENPFWYNYTVNDQSWISLGILSFKFIFGNNYIDTWRESVSVNIE